MITYKEIHAEKKFLKELDFSAFEIPRYQRPYCWERKNVQLLLDCILQNLHKKEYGITGQSNGMTYNSKTDKVLVIGPFEYSKVNLIYQYLNVYKI